MATVEELLVAGWQFKRAGDYRQAERAYRQAVQVHAGHPEAWAGLGTFCLQRGKPDEAIEHLRRALQLRPDEANVHSNLGIALASRGRLPEAIASFAEAVRLNPAHPDARANLGNALRETGRLDEAVTCLRETLALQPANAAAHHNLGLALLALRRLDEAVPHLRQAVQRIPNDPAPLTSLGLALADQEKLADAAACFEQARRMNPGSADAHANLGIALGRQGKPAAALAALREAQRLQPNSAVVLNGIGVALANLGDFAAAVDPLQEALRLCPDYVDALVNLGDSLRCCDRPGEALASLCRALELKNDHVDGHHNLALLYADLGRTAEAFAEFEAALRLKPDFPQCRKNRGLVWLRHGNWEQGWSEFEWRWQCREFKQPAFSGPRWDGGDLPGKTLLLWAEQGLGDTLQLVRYAAPLKERGASVLLLCPAALHPLLESCAGIDRLIPAGGDEMPAHDVQAPLMSLPGILGTTVANVHSPIPYLSAGPSRVLHWQRELAPVTGFRIGVCWQGNTKFGGDRRRSFPLSQLAPLAAVPGVRLVSLQKGHGVEQLAALPRGLEVVDLGEKLDQGGRAFLDTAAVIRNLDLVVTCDTAIGHLAGALGAPVWLALSASADWRWLTDRSDTPWYPTMRLFRQKELGKWEDVFADMARELTSLPLAPAGRHEVA
jgi:tetratricopeptide (TPR) repeat protein